VPTVDDQGTSISTPIASFPTTLAPRQPVGRHSFVGANSYVLRLIADAIEWSGAAIPASELTANATRTDAFLASSVALSVRDVRRDGDHVEITIRVENQIGHKLPSGYPSRRLWLHVTAQAATGTVFESGAVDDTGAIVDATGRVLPLQPHYDTIDAADQVQIWEAQLVDINGAPTHLARNARRYAKDNRLLPRGFAPTSSDRARTEPVGVINDASFVGGSDEIRYRIAAPPGATIDVELLFQSVRPDIVDKLAASSTPAGARFVELVNKRPITPLTLAHTPLVAP
jgi:hypothetical protein